MLTDQPSSQGSLLPAKNKRKTTIFHPINKHSRQETKKVDCGERGVTDCTSIKPLDLGALGPT